MKLKSVLTNRFVQLIEENHQEITEQYMNNLLRHPDTVAFQNLDRQIIYEYADNLYRELSKWIARNYSKEEIAVHYRKIGHERFEQGIPFSQAVKAMTLQKRHLWLFVLDKLYDDPTVYKEAVSLNNRVVLYFDRAAFFMLQGYEDMLYRKI
ncbi:MAG TPA: hypothetical protein VKQ10_07480 [Spirochaetota bacterium]|nr:hypothetical protein [Spirochaetota bacterium]